MTCVRWQKTRTHNQVRHGVFDQSVFYLKKKKVIIIIIIIIIVIQTLPSTVCSPVG